MKPFVIRVTFFLLLVCLGCSLITFGLHWFAAQVTLNHARETGVFTEPLFRGFVWAILPCFLIIAASAWLAGFRLSLLSFTAICLLTLFFTVVTGIVAARVGRYNGEYFLDGLTDRVTASGIENESIVWADHIFADKSLNPKAEPEIHLPLDKTPSFFLPLFNTNGFAGLEPPEVLVDYGKDKTVPEQIQIQMSYGADWGIIIVKSRDAMPDFCCDPKPRRYGNRSFVYLYFYK